MHLDTYTQRLREEVTTALDLLAGDADTAARDHGRRLLLALDPAVRLVLLETTSDAAAEISTLLPSAHVEARLRGRDVEFVAEALDTTDPEPADPRSESPAGDAGTEAADEPGDLTRVSLRLPEGLKARAEELAAAQGTSLNAWLVDAVRRATHPAPTPPLPPAPPSAPGHLSSRRLTGWA